VLLILHMDSFQLLSSYQGAEPVTYSLVRRKTHLAETIPDAHLYRISHPLGQAVLTAALQRQLKPASIQFFYSKYSAKISVLESLLGKSGYLFVYKASIESLERLEERLLFCFCDHSGNLFDSTIASKMLQLDASTDSVAISIPESIQTILHGSLDSSKQAFEFETNQNNLKYFEKEVDKLDGWADDLKEGQEQEIKKLDALIKQTRRYAKAAPTLEQKLSLQKEQRKLEQKRSQLRRELFQKQDEIDANRDRIIGELEGKLTQSVKVSEVIQIEWRLV